MEADGCKEWKSNHQVHCQQEVLQALPEAWDMPKLEHMERAEQVKLGIMETPGMQ